jgi:Fur family transcriptional regulator, stress-responsive regulator
VTSHANRDQTLVEALRTAGNRVTSQRLVIHRALRELDRHVSAEEVLSAVGDRLPNISLPTIYSTLELFERLGIVKRISPRPGRSLYDPRLDDHHHLVCRRCGSVEDVDADLDSGRAVRAARKLGFAVERVEVVVGGLCAKCAERA